MEVYVCRDLGAFHDAIFHAFDGSMRPWQAGKELQRWVVVRFMKLRQNCEGSEKWTESVVMCFEVNMLGTRFPKGV
jgi:hypothetical protein